LLLIVAGVPLWMACAQVKWIRVAPVWLLAHLADGSSSQIAAIDDPV
jgi:hypothetical protein